MKLRDGPNWIYPLDGKHQVYVGRRADNDLRLTDPAADTRQAVIYWEDGRYKINNLSRRTPTRVNKRPITKQNLGNGNTIELGRTRFIFRDRSKHR
jgi:pSer/pThr/pTyr-binding forkhead associated (FHA) protein